MPKLSSRRYHSLGAPWKGSDFMSKVLTVPLLAIKVCYHQIRSDLNCLTARKGVEERPDMAPRNVIGNGPCGNKLKDVSCVVFAV